MVEEAADEPDEIEYDPEANSITLTLNGTIVSVDIEIQVHARAWRHAHITLDGATHPALIWVWKWPTGTPSAVASRQNVDLCKHSRFDEQADDSIRADQIAETPWTGDFAQLQSQRHGRRAGQKQEPHSRETSLPLRGTAGRFGEILLPAQSLEPIGRR